jgi:hypothetical protein
MSRSLSVVDAKHIADIGISQLDVIPHWNPVEYAHGLATIVERLTEF